MRSARGAAFAFFVIAAASFGAAALAAEHLHFIGDDVGGITLDAILLVFVRAQLALDVYLSTFLQVLAGDFRQAAEEFHPVPFGAFLLLAGLLVLPRFGGGDADRGDRRPAWCVASFRIGAQIADQNDLVDAACHGFPRCMGGCDVAERIARSLAEAAGIVRGDA